MAERVGFEPTVALRQHRFSRAVPLTTRTPLLERYFVVKVLLYCLCYAMIYLVLPTAYSNEVVLIGQAC